jgi:hypothetical protein
MIVLRCTRTLLRRLHQTPVEDASTSSTVLGDWYANILWVYRKALVLAVSARTLLPVLVPARDPASLGPRLAEAVGHMLAALGIPAHQIESARVDQLCQGCEDLRTRALRVALGLDAVLLGGREVDDGVDPIRCDSQPERQLDVTAAKGIHEGVEPTARRDADSIGDAVAVRQGDDSVVRQPAVMRVARQPDDGLGTCELPQLHRNRSHSARGTRDGQGLSGQWPHRLDRRRCRRARDEQGARLLPRHMGRSPCQVICRNDHEVGLAGAIVGEADHLVARPIARDRAPDLLHHTGEIAPLPGRELRGPSIGEGPLADRGLAWIDPGRFDSDQHLSRTGNRPLDLDDA